MSKTYIEDDLKQRILDSADLIQTIQWFVPLKKDGANLKGRCTNCSDDDLKVSPGKVLFNCFKCESSGKFPMQYLQQQQAMTFIEGLEFLADKLDISIEQTAAAQPKKQSKRKKKKKEPFKSFRDKQLEESGIPEEAQRYSIKTGEKTVENFDRYRKGRLTEQGDIDINGDDMILVYRDIEGKPVTYRNKKGTEKPFYRVRHKYPERHLFDGKPMKYKSPPGTESVLWLSEYLIRQFELGGKVATLFIPEGEKKTDILGAFKYLAAGIMGIHNLSVESMPYVFEQIIRKFDIQNVVLLFDLDWRDISLKNDPKRSVDQRPKGFLSAAIKFRDFFYSYIAAGEFNLKILLGTHISEENDKGLDDFLCRHKGKEAEILSELDDAVVSQSHKNKYWELYDVTNWSGPKMRELWHLHNEKAFLEQHKEALKDLHEFRLGQLRRRYNHDKKEFELAEPLLPTEKYWKAKVNDKGVTNYYFDNIYVENFFKNRGIGIYSPEAFERILVHIDERKMVTKVDEVYIQSYILEFTKSLEQRDKLDIARWLKSNITKFFSPAQLNLLSNIDVNLVPTAHNRQVFVAKNGVIEITEDKIQLKKNFSYNYFDSDVIKHEFSIMDPLFKAKRVGNEWNIELTKLGKECEFLTFLYRTSCTYWKGLKADVSQPDGSWRIDQKDVIEHMDKATAEDRSDTMAFFITKLLAIGYTLHNHEDLSLTKAIICNDLKESGRKEAFGGTGKSILATCFKHITKFFFIDGAKRDLMASSRFIFEGVDKETRVILFDDIKDDFDFQALFPKLTWGLKADEKGTKAKNVGLKKYWVTLNGQIRKNDASTERRMYHLGFTDYYGLHRTPYQDYGHNLFTEWDKRQWDLFLNLIMQSCQLFLKHKLNYTIPKKQLEQRKMRLDLGDSFIEWAKLKYLEEGEDGNEAPWSNIEIEKNLIYKEFVIDYPNEKRWNDTAKVKRKLEIFAKYVGLDYNIRKQGKDIKSNGREYICISNDKYDMNSKIKCTIQTDIDRAKSAAFN